MVFQLHYQISRKVDEDFQKENPLSGEVSWRLKKRALQNKEMYAKIKKGAIKASSKFYDDEVLRDMEKNILN